MIVFVSSVVFGQQPKRKIEPYVAPLLPAEQAWAVNLPAPPSAAAAIDNAQVYVPLEAVAALDEENADGARPAMLVAVDRETGATRWTYPVASQLPPALTNGVVVVAASDQLHAVGPRDGQPQWKIPLARPVRAPMISRGALLLTLQGDELVAFNIERRAVAWQRAIGESGSVLMTADDEAVYAATEAGRVIRVNLSDGSLQWEQTLEGVLSEPTIDRDRLFVGSNANRGSLWSLDAQDGEQDWRVRGRFLTAPVVGTAVDSDVLYVVSKDTFLRALRRNTGNQLWKKPAGTQLILPPRVFEGVVAVTGLSPVLSAFLSKNGTAASTWTGPPNALLQGPPLIETPQPFRVNIVVLLRNGQIFGLKSTEMLFKTPAPTQFKALPGRSLPREELPAPD